MQQFGEAQRVEKALDAERALAADVRRKFEASRQANRLINMERMFSMWREDSAIMASVPKYGVDTWHGRGVRAKYRPVIQAFRLWRGVRDPEDERKAALLQRFVRTWMNGALSATFDAWTELVRMAKVERVAARDAAAAMRDTPMGRLRHLCLTTSGQCLDALSYCVDAMTGIFQEPESALGTHEASDDGGGGPCARLCDCSAGASGWRAELRLAIQSAMWSNVMMGAVLANLLLMCMPYYGMSEQYAMSLELASDGLTWLFILEMALKLIG